VRLGAPGAGVCSLTSYTSWSASTFESWAGKLGTRQLPLLFLPRDFILALLDRAFESGVAVAGGAGGGGGEAGQAERVGRRERLATLRRQGLSST